MAADAIIAVSFSEEMDDAIRLEQKPWDQAGTTTIIDLIRGMASMFFDEESPLLDCGYDSARKINTEIYAYPTRDDLQFRIGVTMGDLSAGILEVVTVIESVDFKLNDSATLSYTPHGPVTTSWMSEEVYNVDGDTVSLPLVTVTEDTVAISDGVYGSLKAVYQTLRYRYALTIEPRENSPENSYQATVWAAWDGGVSMLTTTDPPGAEEDLKNDTDCFNRGGIVTVIPPGDDPVPTVPPGGEETVTLDYCKYGEGYYAE